MAFVSGDFELLAWTRGSQEYNHTSKEGEWLSFSDELQLFLGWENCIVLVGNG